MARDHVRTLREHDLQVTAQRVAVIRAVSERPHGTANEIIDDVRREIGAISRQSVYDTLGLLTERNIIRRIQPAGSSARFEDRVGDNHHHLICRSCDRLIDVDCAAGETPCLAPVDAGDFVVHEAEVTYWGMCPTCREHEHDPAHHPAKESP
jgi:Fur family transcriptional regulator, stress-responsive regulator